MHQMTFVYIKYYAQILLSMLGSIINMIGRTHMVIEEEIQFSLLMNKILKVETPITDQ